MEDEPERFRLRDGRIDGERQRQALRRLSRPERLDLLAARPSMEPFALVAEPGDERRLRQLRDLADLPQAEPRQPGSDVRVRREKRRWQRREERRVPTRLDRAEDAGLRMAGGDRRGEAGPGDPG